MLYLKIHTQPSKSHKIAHFLVYIQLRNVWDTSMVWNAFFNPVIVEDSGHSKESPVFDLLVQVCPKKDSWGSTGSTFP